MNPFFVCLLFLGLMSLPSSATLYLSVARLSRLRLRLRLGGVPIRRVELTVWNRAARLVLERRGLDGDPPKQVEVGPDALRGVSPAVLRLLLSPEARRAALRAVEIPELTVRARVAFQDAAKTALCCAALTALMDTALRCAPLPGSAALSACADFNGRGARIQISGIVRARVGSLLLSAIAIARVWLRISVKETRHGASD